MITEIVNVLADIVVGMNKTSSLDDVVKHLNIGDKYEKNIIATAYSWIYEKIVREILSEEDEKKSDSFRIVSDEEIVILGKANYDYLLHFLNIGLITNNDLNSIIDRLRLFPLNQIHTDIINVLILSLFIDINSSALPGSRLLLSSSDTIN